MKFPQLPPGQRFRWQGGTYRKIGPLTAQGDDGAVRMIPRSALVEPIEAGAAAAPRSGEETLPAAQVIAALDALTEQLGAAAAALDAPAAAAMAEAIADARRAFLAAIGR